MAQCDDGSDGSSEEEQDSGSDESVITQSSGPGFQPDVHLPRRSNVDETLTNPNNDINEDEIHSDGGETRGGDSTYSLSSETRRGEEDDVSGTEEHLSEYFLAIQKVLHDIATKLTNTHRRTCASCGVEHSLFLFSSSQLSTSAVNGTFVDGSKLFPRGFTVL